MTGDDGATGDGGTIGGDGGTGDEGARRGDGATADDGKTGSDGAARGEGTTGGDGRADICVHGLGYIGLPTATMLAVHGWTVVGYDTDPDARRTLENGGVPVDEPGLDALVAEAVDSGRFSIADEVVPASYHVVCVPTPLTGDGGGADLSYVESAVSAIRPHLRPGDAVVVESTVPPGTTVAEVRPVLEGSGLRAGEEFDLLYCPETALPGNTLEELRTNDRIVGAVDGGSVEPAVRLYQPFVEGEIRAAPDATTAEFVKLIQNTFRDTNIALANEIAKLADDYGVDTGRAIDLANHHPRVGLHDPGPGVGGHCLPIDPWFLGHDSDALDLVTRARRVNESMTDHVLDVLAEELAPFPASTVGILGVAYKGNVGDTRQSPGLALARALRAETSAAATAEALPNGGSRPFRDVDVALHDSHVDDAPVELTPLDETLEGADAVVITADHDEYADLDPAHVADRMSGDVVFDTKGVLDPVEWAESPVGLRRL